MRVVLDPLKRVARAIVPARYRPALLLTNGVRSEVGGAVHGGPFRGMSYVDEAVGSCYIPKLLGIYERELHKVVEEICVSNPQTVLDLGGGEGYYAVGIACRVRGCRVICYEVCEKGRTLIHELAARNAVTTRVDVRGLATGSALKALMEEEQIDCVICDVEGAEHELLDPSVLPALRRAAILVETHEFARRGITRELYERFERTHNIEVINTEERERSEFSPRPTVASLLPRRYLDWAISEWRPEPMQWLWMRVK